MTDRIFRPLKDLSTPVLDRIRDASPRHVPLECRSLVAGIGIDSHVGGDQLDRIWYEFFRKLAPTTTTADLLNAMRTTPPPTARRAADRERTCAALKEILAGLNLAVPKLDPSEVQLEQAEEDGISAVDDADILFECELDAREAGVYDGAAMPAPPVTKAPRAA